MQNPPLRRLATPDDLAAVYAIYMHPEVVPYLGIDPVSLAEFAPYFAGLLSGDSFYVVTRGGDVRGFYRATRQQGRSRHVVILTTLAISPAEKGSGLAKAMIDEAIELLRADGVLRVELTLEADNARASSFYRKLGFEEEGRLRKAYKRAHEADYCDEIVMARWLG
ncbi:MAG TPA: GNAT family N-acetyltransferase [Steroidobacteraceae bacterium]|nr:GNAT family N-acetyltransferase [Steroidobacteraceae bacterium]